MPLRPLVASILIFIFVIIGFFEIYLKAHQKYSLHDIPSNERWIGVIDMGYAHGIDVKGIIQGHDALLVVDNNNPLFQEYVLKTLQEKPFLELTPFEIGNYDSNEDGLIDEEDPIYHFLHIVTFVPGGQGYQVKTLEQAGIHGIKIKHLEKNSNHLVIMSDGTTRVLYEINKPGGTSIYINGNGSQITNLPEISHQ